MRAGGVRSAVFLTVVITVVIAAAVAGAGAAYAGTAAALDSADAAELIARAYHRTFTTAMYYEETALTSVSGEVKITARRVWQASADRFRAEAVDETGRTVVTIADGAELWVVDAASRSVLRQRLAGGSPQPPALPAGGRSRVAEGVFGGRPVQIVSVRGERQTHTYTIDVETGIVLKEEITGPGGELLYMAYRYNLQPGGDFDSSLFAYEPSPEQRVTTDRSAWRAQRLAAALSEESGFAVHVPTQLPEGYELLDGAVHYVDDAPVVVLHYRKGPDVLSIYQQEEPITAAMVRQLAGRLASGSNRSLVTARRAVDGRSYLAIGPLTERELQRVLASMEPY